MSENLLDLKDVSFAYPGSGWRLAEVSLTVSPGQIVGLIGPNGSGKSTLLKLAAGVLHPEAGRILLNKRPLYAYRRIEAARILGYLPQVSRFTFDYRVEDIVAMGRYPHSRGLGFLDSDDLTKIREAMQETEVWDYRQRCLSQLSGGERQRVLLASVLVQEPQVLLLDEPTTGLDIHHQVRFYTLLESLRRRDIAVVIVSHELNLIAQFARSLLLLNQGQTVLSGSAEEVIHAPELMDTYHQCISVTRHPDTGRDMILPRWP